MMRAEILSIGTELLLGDIVDTNSSYIAARLAEYGIDLYNMQTVGDNLERVAECIATAASRSDLVIMTGGLGPTEDDLTRNALALFLGEELVEFPEVVEDIRRYFERTGREMPPSNVRQAMAPKGAVVLRNPVGTAPGLIVPHRSGKKMFILLPGVPKEMKAIFEGGVIPYFKENGIIGNEMLKSRVLHTVGIGESSLVEKVQDILDRQVNPTIAPLASEGEVVLRITAKSSDLKECLKMLDDTEAVLRERLGDLVYGVDSESLEEVVGRMLRERGLSIATAESCSGGLLSHRLTNIPGSSSYFIMGVTTYANSAKERILGVPRDILDRYGAVSRETADAMAEGIRRISGADIGVSITGIAGPGGGTPEKPVGLVYASLASPGGILSEKYNFVGSREEIKHRTTNSVLNMIRLFMLKNR